MALPEAWLCTTLAVEDTTALTLPIWYNGLRMPTGFFEFSAGQQHVPAQTSLAYTEWLTRIAEKLPCRR